jgi:hypothetical protein
MRVPYGESVASYTGPESCVRVGNCAGEALTGDVQVGYRAAKRLTPRRAGVQGADAVTASGKPHCLHRNREVEGSPARSETPSMYANIPNGNREILELSVKEKMRRPQREPTGARR